MREILERTIEPDKYGEGFVMYEWSIYESWSVLAGQDCKAAADFSDTVDELTAKYPDAIVHDYRVDAGNSVAHLPGEEWDDAREEYVY